MNMETLCTLTRRIGLGLLLLVWVALLTPVSLTGQETLTVHNGNTTNEFVPIYGYWCDAYQKSEMVYPAAELSVMSSGEISQLTFYTVSNPSEWGGTFQVFLKEVNYTQINAFQGNSGASIVYEGALNASNSQVVVNFTQPYVYQGGNLLIGVYRTVSAKYSSASFYGETVNGASVQGYSSNGLNSVTATQRNFLPKTTFSYVIANKPKNLTASNVTAHEATLSWTEPNEDVIGYQYQYKAGEGEWTALESTTNTSVALTGLTSDTEYTFLVKALFPDNEESTFASTIFHTEVSCPVPTDLLATFTEGDATVASLSWTENGSATNWVLEYGTASDFTDATQVNVSGTPTQNLTGLTPETKYYARVKADCGEGDQSQWGPTLEFMPTAYITLDEGTITFSNSPVCTYADYSFSQQIYTAEEIAAAGGVAGTITSLAFHCQVSSTPYTMEGIQVYMINTDKASFTDNGDVVAISPEDKVYEGPLDLPAGNGWTTLVLDNEFDYDGTNILICVIDPTEGLPGSNGYSFYCTPTSTISTIYRSEYQMIFDLDNITSLSVTTEYYHPNIRLLPTFYPKPRSLTVSDITAYAAHLAWVAHDSSVTGYQYQYKLGEGEWTALESTTGTSVDVTLVPEGEYVFRVKALYADGASDFVSIAFTALATCPKPTDLQFALTEGDGTVVTLTWLQGYEEDAWVLQYGTDPEFAEGSYTEVTSGFTVVGTTITANVTGLTPETSYYARVKANCAIDDQSYWSNVVAFTPTDMILLTVNDNDYTNENVPVRVRCVSYGTGNKSQFIIPAADIADVVDGQIKSLTFYIYRDVLGEESQDPPVFRVYFAEIDYTAFSSTDFYDWTAMTQVYEGNLVFGDDKMTMTITLDAPYLYNGGNLMIGFDEVTVGNINLQHCYYCPEDLNWSGQGSFNYNTAVYSYTWSDNTETTGQVDFLPKTTISYVNRGITDTPRPKYLASNTVLAYSANVTWSAPVDGVTGYQYQYKTDEGEWTDLVATSDTLVHLTELTPLTHYTFRVKALYPDNAESLWASIGITTHNVCDVPTDLAYTLVPYNGSKAIISWMENGEATNWVLQYGTSETFEPEYTHEININDGFVREGNHVTYTLTGLTEVVTCVRVRPDCGEEELWSDFIYFTPAYASFAFNSNDSYNYYNNYVPVYGNNTHYGTASQFVIPGTMLADLAGTTIHRIRFRSSYNYIVSNSTFGDAVFEVFVKEVDNTSFASSDLADWADWDDLDRVYHGILTLNSKQMWIDFEEGFAYGGDNLLIGFKQITQGNTNASAFWVGKGNGDPQCSVWAYKSYDTAPTFNYAGFASNYADSGPFLPEIIFRYIPAEYQRIDAVTTVDITATTAQFSWEAPNANVTGYAYQYKLCDSEWPEEWTETTATEVTLQDLRQAAHQRFRVKALYGEHESAPFTVDFMTECDTYADIPFFEDFEGYGYGSGVMPYCWNRIGNSNYPNIQMASGEYYLGRYYLRFQYGSSSSYPDQYAILPQMQNLDDLRVKFYAKVENPDRPVVVYVGVMTDPADASTFTLIGEVNVSDYNYWKYKVSLESYTGGNGYIALKVAPTENGQYSSLYVDNVTVEPIPSCEEPQIESVFEVTGHTATLRWTDEGASAWQVYAATENILPDEPDGLQTVTTNPGTINGLEAETEHYVWIRSVCGDGTYSPWSDAFSFTTNLACPKPIEVTVSNVTGHTATLSWTDLYGDPTAWMICLNEDENLLVTADSNPFTLTGLEAETEYNVKVKAWCGENDGYSEWSNEVYFYTPVSCLPVTDLQVTELGTTQATLTWDIDPQQGLDNMPAEWYVQYIAAPATLYDFESVNTTPQYYVYSDNSETPWSIVEDADNAHSTSHYMQSPDCYGYIEFSAYGGGAASFWVKSLVEDVNVTIDVYYNSSFSGGGDEPGYRRNNDYLGQFTVPFDAYKKITLDLADYQGEGTLELQLEGQIALDDITVNMPDMTVTNQTLNFNQGSLGEDVFLDGWLLEYDGGNGYLVSEADYTNDWGGAYADFPIQLGGEVTFRAKALNVTEAVEYTVFVWDWNFDEVIAQTQISVTDAFADYAWDLSDYSGMAYLEFIANNQPSLVIDDLTLDMPSVGYLTTTVSDNMLQMNDLQQFTVYTVGVQAHCGEDDDSQMAMPISFVPALCESEDQCKISYEWNTVDDAWNDAYLKVIHHESGLRVAQCQMEVGTSGIGYFSLCDGEVYDLYYDAGGKGYVDFTVYDAAGEVIASYAMFQSLTEEDDPYIQFTMDCDVCQKPIDLAVSNLTTQSATLTWEQGGDVTSWLVSYRDLKAMGDAILNQSNWTAVPQGWLPLTFDEDDNLVETEDWTPDEGALVSNTASCLFIPVALGGQAVVTARGSEDEALLIGIYQGGSPVGMNVNNLPYPQQYVLSEDPQQYVVDLSGYQGDGYLFLYHGCGDEPANLYLDQLVVYGLADWSEGVIVNTTPTYTIENLTSGTSYQARVQAVCGVGEYGNPAMVSFVTPFCNPENQCAISYVLRDSYGDSWENAYISVVHHNSNTEVARLTMQYNDGNELAGTLALCDGETYDFMYVYGNCCSHEHSFAIYAPSGEVVMDYLEAIPNQSDVVSYTMDCSGTPTTVQLSEGWNWWAPTSEVSVDALATAIGDYVEAVITEDGEPVSTFVPGEMYRILVNTDCEFTLMGVQATSAEIDIEQGTNWFGFIGTEMSVADAFADFAPATGDKVVSQTQGFAIFNGTTWEGTLTQLSPGQGYVYVSKDSESKTLYLGPASK